MDGYELITIVGPTACGKTKVACNLALALDSEIISGDSRQVYTSMDLGTGKDLDDYKIGDKQIPYHLIDLHPPGYKYNIYEYQHDFHRVYRQLRDRGILPILCGGSGLYVESVLRGYSLANVPENKELRQRYRSADLETLTQILASYGPLHNQTDVDTAQRAIRAIEIEEYRKNHAADATEFEPIHSLVIGLSIDRDIRRQKISDRLRERFRQGMADEVKAILATGVAPDDLLYYGLEYKYITLYVLGRISYQEMFDQLEIAIHQFAKRQMTWFRGMEKRGVSIHWIDALLPDAEKTALILELLNKPEIDKIK